MGKIVDELDTSKIFGRYDAQEDRRNNLHHRVVSRALNMPQPEDVQVTNTTTNGFDWKHLAVVAASVLGAAGLYTFAPKSQPPQSPAPYIVPQAVQSAPTPLVAPQLPDSIYKVEIQDADTHQPIVVDWRSSAKSAPPQAAKPTAPTTSVPIDMPPLFMPPVTK